MNFPSLCKGPTDLRDAFSRVLLHSFSSPDVGGPHSLLAASLLEPGLLGSWWPFPGHSVSGLLQTEADLAFRRLLSPPHCWQTESPEAWFCQCFSMCMWRPLLWVRVSSPEGWLIPTPMATGSSLVLDRGKPCMLGPWSPRVLTLVFFWLILEPGSLSLCPLSVMLQNGSVQLPLKTPFKARNILGMVSKEGSIPKQVPKCVTLRH